MNLNVYRRSSPLETDIILLGSFDKYISLVWSEGYNTLGSFSVEVPLNEYTRSILTPERYVTRNDRDTVMIITSVSIKSNTITATGHTATWMLEQVAVPGEIVSEDEKEKGVNIEDTLEKAFREHFPQKNSFPLIFTGLSNLQDKYYLALKNKTFYQACETMCESADIGFRTVKMFRDTEKHIKLELYKPETKEPHILSTDYGNIFGVQVTKSTECYKNTAYIIGPDGSIEKYSERGLIDDSDTEYAFILDAKNIDSRSERIAKASESIRASQNINSVKFIPHSFDFGEKYDVGDKVIIRLGEYGLTFDARVTEYHYTEKNGKETITITVGTPILRR